MKKWLKIGICLIVPVLAGCSAKMLFSSWNRETFPTTRVSQSSTKTLQVLNESPTEIQHVMSMAYYTNSNKEGHFQITDIRVGTEPAGQKDIFIPPLGVLNIGITYAPLNLETSEAEYAGWITTSEDRAEPVTIEKEEPVEAMKEMIGTKALGDAKEYEPAIHRSVLMIAYDGPEEGYVSFELVGTAIPGPNGEETAIPVGQGAGECDVGGNRACFIGTFSIDLPGLMSGGALEVPMNGPLPLTIDGGAAELDMNEFPPIIIPLKGNGPGEALEGKPVDAVTIIISGTPDTVTKGSFDGANLILSDVSFRVRVDLGELTYDDITPGLATAVDFNIPGLEITTDQPFDGANISFGVETTLSSNPSGNGLFDSFLANAKVVVKFMGKLELP